MNNKINSIWLAAQYITTILFSLVALKLNLLQFGNERFGIWIMFAAFWGIGSVMDLGFGTALVKFIAGASEKKSEYLSELVSTCFFLLVLLGLILLAIGNLVGEYLFFNIGSIITSDTVTESRILFSIMGVTFYLNFILIFLKSIFEGHNDYVTTSRIALLNNVLILASVIVVYIFNLSLVSLAALYFLSSLINCTVLFVFYKKRYPEILVRLRYFKKQQIKRILTYSSAVQLTSIFSVLIDPAIKYIIGNYYNTGFISIYEIARRFSTAISSLFYVSFKNILPITSKLETKNDVRNFVINDGTKFVKLGIVYSGIVFGILSGMIILFMYKVFGEEQLIIVFLILSVPEAINNYGYTYYLILLGAGKAAFLALLQLTNLIVTLVFLGVGFLVFNSPLGLLGYLVSVSFGNYLIFFKIKQVFQIDVKLLINKDMKKLFVLIGSLLCSILIINSNEILTPYVLTVFTLLMIFVFYKDSLFYFNEVLPIIKDFRQHIFHKM